MKLAISALLLTLCCSAHADSFSGNWIHKEGKAVETVTIQPDGNGYRATNTTEPEDMWGPIHMSFVKSSEQLSTPTKK